jgi:hypothetical protein
VVGEAHAELGVERRLVLDVGVGQHGDDVPATQIPRKVASALVIAAD